MGSIYKFPASKQRYKKLLCPCPNVTIYNKLITDFTPNTPKYVFKGIAEFAQNPPLIITGDNYESSINVTLFTSLQDRYAS
jgi:type III restriction enzyme